MTPDLKSALLTSATSRQNKLWLAIINDIQWRWQGVPRRSRMAFLVEGEWREAKSYDEDVVPLMDMKQGTKVC